MLCLRKNKYHIAAALLRGGEPFIPSSVLWKYRGRRTVRKQSQDFITGLWRRYCSQKTLRGMLPVNRNVGTLNALM